MLYDRRWLRSTRVEARVVSVGNLVAGGTGKTPCTVLLARVLRERGHKVAVLLRGYGRRGRGVVAASEGAGPFRPFDAVGDEALVLCRHLPGVPVVVGTDRVRAARWAIARFGSRLLILDDGFQHRALARDLDIVLVDGREPFGFGHLLPRGLLREPPEALRRAAVIVVSRADRCPDLAALRDRLEALNGQAPVLAARHEAVRLLRLPAWEDRPLAEFQGAPVFAFSGIADPASLVDLVGGLEARLVGLRTFSDHHVYTAEETAALAAEARRAGAQAVVTTEKDAVRLPETPESPPLFVLEVAMRLLEDGLEVLLRKVEALGD